MAISNTTSANGQVRPGLATLLALSIPSIEKGLINVLSGHQDTVALSRFQTSNQNTVAPADTPDTPADASTKDEKIITLGDGMFYDEFNPLRTFEDDWVQFYAQGRLTDAQASPLIRNALQQTVVESIGQDIENLIWSGDTTGQNAWSNRFDGFLKFIDADTDVNDVTDVGLITPSNIFDIMDAMILGTRDAVLEKGSIRFIVSHKDKYKMLEAGRSLSFKDAEVQM
jgi:hypothetical protein